MLRGIRPCRQLWRTLSSLSKQEKLSNFGQAVRMLDRSIPHLLQTPLPSNYIHRNIVFEMFPETKALQFTGNTTYVAASKLLQLAVTALLIPHNSELFVISMRVDEHCHEIADRHIYVNWRSISPERPKPSPNSSHIFQPGRIIQSLGLLPDEYPVLAGSFEFALDENAERIRLHVIRNVEYMARPDSPIVTDAL